MSTFIRQYRAAFCFLLVVLGSIFLTACGAYRHTAIDPTKTIGMVRFYVLDETSPKDFAWRVNLEVWRQSGLEGNIERLTAADATRVKRGIPATLEQNPPKTQILVLYVKSDFAQALATSGSNKIDLPFDQVTRSILYQVSASKVAGNAAAATILVMTAAGVLAVAALCSCPYVYADHSNGLAFEGDIFTGATHPQLERHDWLPLSQLRSEEGVYRLQIVNEDPEIQHTNLLELVAIDHPGTIQVMYDKYGRLHTLGQLEKPLSATDLDGRDVRASIEQEDQLRFRGNANTANPRAEDGLMLRFQKPLGARQAKLLIRANTSQWLAYIHKELQRDLGKYGPKVRQIFLEKDSAALQDWALRQNIPLSVWLETSPGKWERADFFNLIGPNAPRRAVLSLDLSKVEGDEVHLKLATGFQFWEIDYAALDYSADLPVRIQVLPLSAATDQHGRDLTALLRADDGQYYVQPAIGDEAKLIFPLPELAAASGRSLFLHAKGHYQIQYEPAAGKPSRRYLRQFSQADAFPKYAREKWQAFARKDTIWTAAAQNR